MLVLNVRTSQKRHLTVSLFPCSSGGFLEVTEKVNGRVSNSPLQINHFFKKIRNGKLERNVSGRLHVAPFDDFRWRKRSVRCLFQLRRRWDHAAPWTVPLRLHPLQTCRFAWGAELLWPSVETWVDEQAQRGGWTLQVRLLFAIRMWDPGLVTESLNFWLFIIKDHRKKWVFFWTPN